MNSCLNKIIGANLGLSFTFIKMQKNGKSDSCEDYAQKVVMKTAHRIKISGSVCGHRMAYFLMCAFIWLYLCPTLLASDFELSGQSTFENFRPNGTKYKTFTGSFT